jgi:hypothetical protein
MTTLPMPPCTDNWETCDFCGAAGWEECRNPDYKKELPMAIGADLDGEFRDSHSSSTKRRSIADPPPKKAKAKDTNPKSAAARAKVSLSLVPSVAIFEMAQAFRDGAAKYGPYNWRKDPVSASVYLDAAFRHIELYRAGQDIASDSGIKHIVHAMSCFAILLDAQLVGTLIDDRDKMDEPELLEAFLELCRLENEG